MRKFIACLTVAAALFAPVALAAPSADISSSVMICNKKGDIAYSALYTESKWMMLRMPLAQLGGSLPSNLTLAAGNLPVGTTITLAKAEQDGSDALLTVSVQRESKRSSVNAISTITLSSDGQALTSFGVPVMGTAYASGL
ncbi:hypothetical protein GCM10022631_27740 [Deinococcus rubellus]|uniref:Uncharacterized protein n=1 Tax=Deinococcus rubellus TaxID=1889240 RepID=A0ABY5YHG0_9DEIO|nr:hypothetical protein [Deinococcus rubellus]UWX63606.1 hypothetical protein N0D28_12820 [Deinococcus rubellus]